MKGQKIAFLLFFLIVSIARFEQPGNLIYFPKPTGLFPVGTTTYHWVDQNRKEKHAKKKSARRELMAQVWYPAAMGGGATMPLSQEVIDMYQDEFKQDIQEMIDTATKPKEKEKFKKELIAVQRALEKLHNVRTYSINHAPISFRRKKFPVIIFSHGFGNMKNYNTANCEHLASHGFVVISVDHTYSCWRTTFPDGRQVDLIEPKTILEKLDRTNEWAADILFILKKLEHLNTENSKFKNRLDLHKIGMFGHSMGGIVTMRMCSIDSRIKAGVSLDAPAPPQTKPALEKPFMAILAENYHELSSKEYFSFIDIKKEEYPSYYDTFLATIGKKHPAYRLIIKKTKHNAFSDTAPLKKILQEKIFSPTDDIEIGVGTIDGFYITKLVNNYLAAFFKKFLAGKDPKLLEKKASPYAEVSFKTWNT